MSGELEALGRKEWHRQSCERALRGALTDRQERSDLEKSAAWQIKGTKALKGTALTVFKELWYWREKEAQRRDRPPFKTLNAETLFDIANFAASRPGEDLAGMPNAPRPLKQELRDPLNRVVREALEMSQAVWWTPPKPAHRPKWGEPENKKLACFKLERERLAKELGIHPSLLATNATLEDIILARPKNAEALLRVEPLLPWQADIIAESFLKIV